MCAPTSRQRVKTVVRFTWRTCVHGISFYPQSYCTRIGTNLIPIIIRKLRARMPSLNARTVHQDVDFMPIFQYCGRESCDF